MPDHGVVRIPVLDVRRRPDHRSEMTSQLLLGEVVRRLGRPRGGWWRAESLGDGYVGWVKEWGLVSAGRARARRWAVLARGRVAVPGTEARAHPAGSTRVSPLPFNARVIAGPARRGWRAVELPDGRRGMVPAAALALPRTRPPGIVARVRSLLGAPYLWGGRSPAGFDCSGFSQQVLAESGVSLPRDAAAQYRACRPLEDPASVVPGDLVFFAPPGRRVAHVGIALGGGYYAHARGWVRIASIVPRNPLCDSELVAQFRGFGRPNMMVLGAPRRGQSA